MNPVDRSGPPEALFSDATLPPCLYRLLHQRAHLRYQERTFFAACLANMTVRLAPVLVLGALG